MIKIAIIILLAVVYANLVEWVIHKYVLHDIGKKKHTKLGSMFSFHWSRHHRVVRKNHFFDPDYVSYKPFTADWRASQGKEIAGLFALVIIHSWLLYVSPVFFVTLVLCTVNYFRVHRKSHVDVEWGKKKLKWHYDHHMLKNQDANFCVTFPLWDYILRTRIKEENQKSKNHK